MKHAQDKPVRCGSCFTFLAPDARFCSQCGAPVEGDGARPAGKGTHPAPPAKGSGSAGFLRALAVLILIAGGVAGGVWLFTVYGPEVDGRSPERPGTDPASRPTEPPARPAPDNAGGATAVTPPVEEDEGNGAPLTPDALLAHTAKSLYLFTGLGRDGNENGRCPAVETVHGVAVLSRFLKGSYTAWVRGEPQGYEITRVVYFDDMLGSAVVRPEAEGAKLESAPPETLAPGVRIFLVRPPVANAPPAILPGRFAGRAQDRITAAPRLLFDGPPPGEAGAAAIDETGRFLGIAPPSTGEGPHPFLPATLFVPGGRASLTSLEELNSIHYEGSFDALVREARALVGAGRFSDALPLFDRARQVDYHRGIDLDREVLNVVLRISADLLAGKHASEALDLVSGRFREFTFSSDLALVAFRAAAEARAFGDAADWMVTVRDLDADLFEKLAGEHVLLCVEWSGNLLLRDDAPGAIGVLRNGITCRPASAILHEHLGNMLKSVRDYEGALAAFRQAVLLSPDLAQKLAGTIDLCYELLETPGSVVLDFDPKDRRITCRALLNGKVWVDFIVDTGASHTAIPVAAAESLGIDVRRVKRRARLLTAGGEKEVPYVAIDTIDLSGLVHKKDFVLINDLPGPDAGYGLLGLNFLNKFHYTVDASSGRMVLRSK